MKYQTNVVTDFVYNFISAQNFCAHTRFNGTKLNKTGAELTKNTQIFRIRLGIGFFFSYIISTPETLSHIRGGFN